MARIKSITHEIGPNNRYRMALADAAREAADLRTRLDSLRTEEGNIEQRLKLLDETIGVLEPLCSNEEGETSPGLTEACFNVLEIDGRSVPQIRKDLADLGVRMSAYKNPLAVLHTTLNRMVVSGQAERVDGKPARFKIAAKYVNSLPGKARYVESPAVRK
ncbi:MAG TPA: hypothetical protein VGQ49_13805 [Bryobacteraceae bacterium]|jgi:hypothetical protein|nr:hypothetical protein [Bryobacteraceae bacterium]